MRGLARTPSWSRGGRYSTPLWYGTLVEGRRPDLLIVDDSDIVNENLGSVEDVIDHYLGDPARLRHPGHRPQTLRHWPYAMSWNPPAGPASVYRVTGTLETQP